VVRRLADEAPHRHSVVAAHLIADEGPTLLVQVHGVRVRVPADIRASNRDPTATEVSLRWPAARPGASPGFFLVDGSRGAALGDGDVLRVYLHLGHPDAAVAAWRTTLAYLEALDVPYRAKIANSRASYPRQDAMVVYLGSGSWHATETLHDALDGIEVEYPTSPFTRRIAPGIAVAWEPARASQGHRRLSFGEHRAAAVADGLIAYARHPCERSRSAELAVALRKAGIDPRAPDRNIGSLGSPDPSPSGSGDSRRSR
jgi:hypothetical protein